MPKFEADVMMPITPTATRAQRFSGQSAFFFVHQHDFGPERMRSLNGGPLAGVEMQQSRYCVCDICEYMQPLRRMCCPLAKFLRCVWVAAFPQYSLRANDILIEVCQQMIFSQQDQVMQRRSVRDDDHARCKLARRPSSRSNSATVCPGHASCSARKF